MIPYPIRLRLYILFLVIISVATFIFFSPIFKINEIKISGNNFVSSDWIQEVVSQKNRKNIFYFPKGRIKKFIIKNIPQIKKISIHKNYFNRNIYIKIIERKPYVNIIAYPDNYLVDEDGYVININKNKKVMGVIRSEYLPIITGISQASIKDITRLSKYYVIFFKGPIKSLIKEFDKNGITFNIQDPWDIRVLSKELVNLKIGDDNNIKEKIKVINLLLKNLSEEEKNRVDYIDVRYTQHPVIKYL